MHSEFALSPILAVIPPLLYLLVGLIPARWANANRGTMRRLADQAGWTALAAATATALAQVIDPARSWTIEPPDAGNLDGFALEIYVNGVTVAMLLLVSFVGAVVTRYARTNLDGDPNQGRFHKWLAMTLAAILSLIVAGNLLLFAFSWIATSLCLHQLLMFYRERPAAVLAAHKKFVASRIGDASLLAAVLLIGSSLHTLDSVRMIQILATPGYVVPRSIDLAAVLIVVSAALKSAQFPFHGWLIQVMEAPTPVSALLHAGIVNAGAFLIVRMSPVISHSETARGLLVAIGLITLALSSLIMLTQTSIKVSLAWSTTAQMGFMLLECGLGLYSLAMLHVVTHSLYKAHAFLASGSSVDSFRAPVLPYTRAGFHPGRLLRALLTGSAITLAVAWAFGITVHSAPALVAASFVVAIASSQLLLLAMAESGTKPSSMRGLMLALLVVLAYFTLHAGFESMLAASVLPVVNPAGRFQAILAVLVAVMFLVLFIVQRILKVNPAALGKGLYLHLYNGLYVDVYITRLLQRVWPCPPPEPDPRSGPRSTPTAAIPDTRGGS